jgi:hypothetical protein
MKITKNHDFYSRIQKCLHLWLSMWLSMDNHTLENGVLSLTISPKGEIIVIITQLKEKKMSSNPTEKEDKSVELTIKNRDELELLWQALYKAHGFKSFNLL